MERKLIRLKNLTESITDLFESYETESTFRYRIRPLKDYPTYRYGWFSKKKGIQVLYGIADGQTDVTTLIFHKSEGWTKSKAEKWMEENSYKFEQLKEKKKQK